MCRVTDMKDVLKGQLACGDTIDIGMMCSFSIPIITICALILLMMIVGLLNIVFWWMPFFRICIPMLAPGEADMSVGDVLGRGISFPPRVGADGRVAWSEGEANIREAIRIVLMVDPGERLRRPTFGTGLDRSLFEPNTTATRHDLEERIRAIADRLGAADRARRPSTSTPTRTTRARRSRPSPSGSSRRVRSSACPPPSR